MPHRRVLLARPRGFCAGVDRAIATVEQALQRFGTPVYVRRQIVHNRLVVADLEQRGAIFVEECDEVPPGSVLVLSAHGVAPEVHEQARQRCLRVIDATCPLVTKVHREARRFSEAGKEILLIGHHGHEEITGTLGQAPDRIHLVQDPDTDIPERDLGDVVWLSQTTLSVDEVNSAVHRLRQQLPHLADPPSDDICYATQNRQEILKEIAPRCALVIVVGSANSSNSVRLVEVALQAGAHRAHLVDDADEIDEAWLPGTGNIGVTSGASAPEAPVERVLQRLQLYGFHDVEVVGTTVESQVFALPPGPAGEKLTAPPAR
jgi:4-hydroxy-3-methylbut-2-enyl diphosphate reductase